MHDTTHYSRHSHQCEILLRQISGESKVIAKMRENKTGNTSQIKRRSKDTTTTTATVCCTGSKYFQQDNQHQINQQQIAIAIKHRVVHDRIPLFGRRSIQQKINRVISFTIKRWEKENQYTQHHTTKSQFLVRVIEFAKYTFYRIHGTCEVQRNQPTKNSQQDNERNTLQFECLIEVELKHSLRTSDYVRNSCCCHGRNQQGKQRRHG